MVVHTMQDRSDGDMRRLQHVGNECRIHTQGRQFALNSVFHGQGRRARAHARRLAHHRVDLRDPRPCEIKQIPLGVHTNEFV